MTLIDDIKRDREAGTPGDWQVGNRYCGNSVYSSTNSDEIVANTHGSQRNFRRDEQIRQQDANARRIARVPQMEAALLAAEELARIMDRPNQNDGELGRYHYDWKRIDPALDAFRKAMGADE